MMEKQAMSRSWRWEDALHRAISVAGRMPGLLELKRRVLAELIRLLGIQGAALICCEAGATDVVMEGAMNAVELEKLVQGGKEDQGTFLCYKLFVSESADYTLVVAPDEAGADCDEERCERLSGLISYLSLYLNNIYMTRQMTLKLEELAGQLPAYSADEAAEEPEQGVWLRKAMLELQERERRRIAADLHDTIIQDMLLVKKRLEAVSLLPAVARDAEAGKQLAGTIRHLGLMNENLRQSLFGLNPYLLEHIGLIRTVAKLLDMEGPEFQIQFVCSGEERIESLPLETKEHMIRLVQELLSNARKHSLATRLNLEISATGESILLSYKDNGVGFDLQELLPGRRMQTHTGFGLRQMQSRVFQLSGQFQLETAAGEGVAVTIRIPLKEGIPA